MIKKWIFFRLIKRTLHKLKWMNKQVGLTYILMILISAVFSILFLEFSAIFYAEFSNKYIEINKILYTDTGIAFIGLSAIIFTLQIFNQQIKNEYTNSVMEKIVDSKFQHLIQYTYLCLITILFIIVPHFTIFIKYFGFFIFFYYITLLIILIMFGIELFYTIEKTNKTNLIKEIEKRCNYILDMMVKQHKITDKYFKEGNISLIDQVNKANSIFISYIQSINLVVRNSLNDPILFTTAMDSYIKICKKRLDIRKNQFTYTSIPFLSEVLPTKDNDIFIEKYIVEYLDEYARIALERKNRDIFYIIQKTFYSILDLGKDNKYENSDEIELTIKVTFSYYIKFLKYSVKLNNDNLLFETISVFEELFVKKGGTFAGLIDMIFTDDVQELSKISLENKSLMNFRNVQGLLTIPMFSVLVGSDENKKYRLEILFGALKSNLVDFTVSQGLIKHKDDARTYLHYMFNVLEAYSYYNIIMEYYNAHIGKENIFVNNTFLDDDILEPFVDFLLDDKVITCMRVLHKDNRYVTGIVNVKTSLELYVDILTTLICDKNFEHIKDDNISLLRKCFVCLGKYIEFYDNNSISIHKIDEFFTHIFYRMNIKENKELNDFIFNNYINLVKNLRKDSIRKEFEDYYGLIENIYEYCDDSKKETYIVNIIKWFASFIIDKTENESLYEIYHDLLNYSSHRFNSEIEYEYILKLSELIKNMIKINLLSMDNDEILSFCKSIGLKVKTIKPKDKFIEKIMKEL